MNNIIKASELRPGDVVKQVGMVDAFFEMAVVKVEPGPIVTFWRPYVVFNAITTYLPPNPLFGVEQFTAALNDGHGFHLLRREKE